MTSQLQRLWTACKLLNSVAFNMSATWTLSSNATEMPQGSLNCPSSGVDIAGANLRDADLRGVNLDGAIGADFTGAKHVPEKHLKDSAIKNGHRYT